MKAPQSKLVRRLLRSEKSVRSFYFAVEKAEKGTASNDGKFTFTIGEGEKQETIRGNVISERFIEA